MTLRKSNIPDAIKKVRSDLSGWLWHFVRRDGNPQDTLRKIITDRTLKANRDHSTGPNVICFTEAPLREFLSQNLILAEEKYKRLNRVGIGFRREWLFARGALPVIYQPKRFLEELPESQRFRHVTIDLDTNIDYTWQREWRLHKDNLEFTKNDVVLVVEEAADLQDWLWHMESDGEFMDGELYTFASLMKTWDFIPLESIDASTLNDREIDVCIDASNEHLWIEDEPEHDDCSSYVQK